MRFLKSLALCAVPIALGTLNLLNGKNSDAFVLYSLSVVVFLGGWSHFNPQNRNDVEQSGGPH